MGHFDCIMKTYFKNVYRLKREGEKERERGKEKQTNENKNTLVER